MEAQSGVAVTLLPHPEPGSTAERPPLLTLIAPKSGTIFDIVGYRIDGGLLHYVRPSGLLGALEVSKVDWAKTSQLNAEQ
jgi:hypothetical protein